MSMKMKEMKHNYTMISVVRELTGWVEYHVLGAEWGRDRTWKSRSLPLTIFWRLCITCEP